MPIVKGFRRFHSNIVSSRQVATEISNLVSESNVEQPGTSSAAPLNAKRPIRKRVNHTERRAMLESFVNRYRAMNLGKFPSPTTAQKEVGGGYYSIKKLLQEMEYNIEKKGPTEENIKHVEKGPASQETSHGQTTEKGPASQETSHSQTTEKETSNGQTTIDQNLCEDPGLESGSNNDKNIDTGNNNITRDDTQNFITKSDEKPEQNPSDDNFAFKDPESQVEEQPEGIRNAVRDKGEEDNELREKSSLWGNLKVMANDFFNMWKK
ncbi:hypothetical protein HanPI659440_Chr08g0297701 [Helianthus annuus]|nr:hypothetical protein HanPI659440_Chr08g0297701 [Helianthus annuus]